MTRKALILGASIAGLSCAKLLIQNGWKVEIRTLKSLNLPTLILNDISHNLLFDVWQDNENNADLFDNSFLIEQRKVYWGQFKEKSTTVNQRSVVIKGKNLVNTLLRKLDCENCNILYLDADQQHRIITDDSFHEMEQSFDWVIDATGRASYIATVLGLAKRYSFGLRCMITAEAKLHYSHNEDASLIESLDFGWVFFAPIDKNTAILQVMVPINPDKPAVILPYLLSETKIIKKLFSKIEEDTITVFKAFPQIISPLYGSNWICIGDAAMSFDPLCGDGTGQAIRSAILAAAIINGIASGLSKDECLRHYGMRLANALFCHLRTCVEYYSAIPSVYWMTEINLMKKDYPYTLNAYDNFLFRLNKFNIMQKEVQ